MILMNLTMKVMKIILMNLVCTGLKKRPAVKGLKNTHIANQKIRIRQFAKDFLQNSARLSKIGFQKCNTETEPFVQ